MAPRFRRRLAVLSLALALSAGTALPVYADDGSAADSAAADTAQSPIGSISIGSASSIELKNASMLNGDDGKIVTFTLTVNNGSNQEVQFIDYWVRLFGSTGTQYSVTLLPEDKSKNKVPAHSSMDVAFYAKVNDATELSDLKFRIIKWDFNAADYERTMGTISVPDDYSTVTPLGQAGHFPVSGTAMKGTIRKVVTNQNDEYYLTTAYLDLENVGMKSASLQGYTYVIQTSEGYQYTLEPSPSSKDPSIAPRVRKELQLNASIPNSIDPNGWKLIVIRPPVSADTPLKLPAAAYALPSAESGDSSAAGEKVTLDYDGNPIEASIKRVSIGTTDSYNMTNVYFNFYHNGTKTIKLADYQFMLQTKDGLSYPLTLPTGTKLSDISLNPRSSKEVQLSVNIPASVDLTDLKLLMIQPAEQGTDNRFNYPVASFTVPAASTSDVSIGVEYPYTNKVGNYTARMLSLQRTPYDDMDILSADFTLANKGDAALSLPSLQGYYLLDGNVKVPVTVKQMDTAISIAGNSSISYAAIAKVPYLTRFSDVRLVLEENADADTVATVAEFRNTAELMKLPVIDKDQTYLLERMGKSAGLKATLVRTYNGAVDDMYYAELEMQNLEKRFTNLSKLTAYVRAKDDTYYPATVTSVTPRVAPNGKAVLAVWSALPKGYTAADLDIVVGEAVTLSTTADGQSDNAYVRAAEMLLPEENATVKSSLDGLSISPYTLSISNVRTDQINKKFSFDYTLVKSGALQPELPADTRHKLILEISDSQGDRFEYALVPGEDLKTDVFSLSKDLTSADANAFLQKSFQAKTYTLKVYDDFGGGYRKLLASSSYKWWLNN